VGVTGRFLNTIGIYGFNPAAVFNVLFTGIANINKKTTADPAISHNGLPLPYIAFLAHFFQSLCENELKLITYERGFACKYCCLSHAIPPAVT
jgi:hypothetical protein